MPPALPTTRRVATSLSLVATIALVAACGQTPQGGFHGFPPAAVTTLVVQPRTLPVSYEYVGQTTGSKEVEVRARVTGILEKRLYTEGGWVKAGQPLFVIDPKPLQAQAAAADAEVVRARALLAQAERELARLKPLAERRAVGQKEADDAASNADLARASLKAAEARLAEVNLNLGYTRVNAPITGLSSRANKIRGQPRQRQRHAAHAPLAGRSDLGAVQRLRERAAAAQPRGRCGPARAAEGQCVRRDGQALRRLDVSAQGPHQFQRHARESVDGHLRDARRDRERRRRPQARAVRPRAAQGRDAHQRDRGPADRGAGRTSGQVRLRDRARTRTARTSRWSGRSRLGDWVEADGTNLWIVETGLEAGDTVIVDGIAKLQPGGAIALGGGAPAAGGPPSKDAAPAKDAAKSAPAPKS